MAKVGQSAWPNAGGLYHAGDQWMMHFEEKGGKSREIPVRHDLEKMLFEYIDTAGIRDESANSPLFRTAYRKTGQLTDHAMYVADICRMFKRRLKDAGLPTTCSPHSVRVTAITDLLEQSVPLEDVQTPGRSR
jgi:site-specific recombinase XerD